MLKHVNTKQNMKYPKHEYGKSKYWIQYVCDWPWIGQSNMSTNSTNLGPFASIQWRRRSLVRWLTAPSPIDRRISHDGFCVWGMSKIWFIILMHKIIDFVFFVSLWSPDIILCFYLILSKAIIFGASCRVRAADKSQFRSTLG